MVMSIDASAIANLHLLPPVGQWRGQVGHYGSGPRKISVSRSMAHVGMRSPAGRFRVQIGKPITPITGSRRIHSASSVICAAAAAGETQTVLREAPTITRLPGKEKSPIIDHGGTGFPPRYGGGGGDGGGGGGSNWFGGFVLFGFLLVLSFLKDIESEKRYREKRMKNFERS